MVLYRELGDRSGEAEALMYLGGVDIDRTSYAQARNYLNHALAVFRIEACFEGQMRALLMLSIAANALGELIPALKYSSKALGLAEQLGDPLAKARILNNLGAGYDASRDSSKALECYLQALNLSETFPNLQLRAMLLANVAEVYQHSGELERAVDYANESLALAEVGYLRSKGETLVTLGKLYLQKGDYMGAEEFFRVALKAAQVANDPHTQALSLSFLAELKRQQDHQDAAKVFSRKASPSHT